MRFGSFWMSSQLALPLAFASASCLDRTWDYIVVGSGASGIPLADRLSESGKSVLLLERGWASSGRWGGTQKPAWLEGTNLTRFDVPALYQYIWSDLIDNTGILCNDISMPAGCILGGGTAVNAGQFYLPTNNDWDFNQPPGFQSKDMTSALQKAKTRLPTTNVPSPDGISYATNGSRIAFDALTSPTSPRPFRVIQANEDHGSRDRVTSKSEFFFLYGEKGGPMSTYLVTASKRRNFKLQLNTTVARVVRNHDEILGVDVEATGPDGINGTIKVTPGTGRVILSAGVFNTAKILFRSGIGPKDQLETVKGSSDGPKLVTEEQWINTPVGENLDDGPALYVANMVPNVENYAWEPLWNSSAAENKDIRQYLKDKTGPLTEIKPSLSPVSWDTIIGEDNKTRTVQWDVNSGTYEGMGIILFASNLNLGKTSRGRLTIDTNLFVNASTLPFFNDPGDNDFKAVMKSAASMVDILNTIPGSSPFFPPAGMGLEEYLRESIRTAPILTSNHWVGSTRMGASCDSPGAVVDATTRVCGTKNLHVADAGIVNGVPTANPQGTLVVAAERAAEVILELEEWS